MKGAAAGQWPCSWDEAIQTVRHRPGMEQWAADNYYDDSAIEAGERFARSDEWKEVLNLLRARNGRMLDLGAGRGIASVAFARNGWKVTAIEPYGGAFAGSDAVRALAEATRAPVDVIAGRAESIPLPNASMDLVYSRSVMHHVADLTAMCLEIARVLRKGGLYLATREPVLNARSEREEYLASHPLHALCGGENALVLGDYLNALQSAGLRVRRKLGPYESAINRHGVVHSYNQLWSICFDPWRSAVGTRAARILTSQRHAIGRLLLRRMSRVRSAQCRTPGRIYSFLSER